MTTFQIWSEGYQATGESGAAMCHGTSQGSTFKEACVSLFKSRAHENYFDANRMTYWGCRLYDNENDARKSFG